MYTHQIDLVITYIRKKYTKKTWICHKMWLFNYPETVYAIGNIYNIYNCNKYSEKTNGGI